MPEPKLQYSVVVPLHNEEENVTELYDRLRVVMDSLGDAFELVFVDDGSSDRTFSLLTQIASKNPDVIYFGGVDSTGGTLIRQQMRQIPSLANLAEPSFLAALNGSSIASLSCCPNAVCLTILKRQEARGNQ